VRHRKDKTESKREERRKRKREKRKREKEKKRKREKEKKRKREKEKKRKREKEKKRKEKKRKRELPDSMPIITEGLACMDWISSLNRQTMVSRVFGFPSDVPKRSRKTMPLLGKLSVLTT
jgi:hypothetical protein